MKLNATISTPKKKSGPFIQNGKRSSFVQTKPLENDKLKRKQGQEKNADEFAKAASQNEHIRSVFEQYNPFKTASSPASEQGLSKGHPLPKPIVSAFKKYFNEDFNDVLIHNDKKSTEFVKEHQAAAITIETHVFLNGNVLKPDEVSVIFILAHELFHTINAVSAASDLSIQLKPLSELNDRSPEQTLALNRAAKIAEGEQGKVDAGKLNPDKTRVGWEYLVEYFSTTLGEGVVVKDKSEYKAGKFLEENIKYLKKGKAQAVKKQPDGTFKVEVQDNKDLLPSWCGIYLFWVLHKAGIHPPNWQFGKPNFTAKDQYKKGEYLPRVGDIVIKNGFNHYALVVKVSPETVSDTKDLKNVKVTTMNGNTMGSNNLGGQIQEKTHDYSYWDFYVNPFFKGVVLTKEADFKLDERLKNSLETITEKPLAKVDLSVNEYDTTLKPVGAIATANKKEEQPKAEDAEPAVVDPKAIMAKDRKFKSLAGSLKKNAKKESEHDTPENKAQEAQDSALSPENERASKAKAAKVEKLGKIPPPKQFKAADLKKSILDEVDKLLKQKEEEANQTGDKPKINEAEIKGVKDKNNQDIQKQKTETIGDVEQASKEVPDESSVEERTATDLKTEDSGKQVKISKPENAIAKPIAEERITLEKESGRIDDKMAEHDIDEQQLEDSDEPNFTDSLKEKKDSQKEAANVKQDYQKKEEEKLTKDEKSTKYLINKKTEQIHDVRKGEFGNVETLKGSTKQQDELKRKEVADHIEGIYTASEKSVTEKLNALETSVNTEFDEKMTIANQHFKDNINNALDDEFTAEWFSKLVDRSDYNKRVKIVFVAQSEKYKKELSDLLDPLTQKIADTLNAITLEITVAKTAVEVYVQALDPALQAIGVSSAKNVLDKFSNLEKSVEQKQEALTSSLANKYADGVSSLEKQFKEVMDSRKSWLERAYDAVVGVIMEILNLLSDLKKALEQAAEYASQIIKKPKQFFNNLVKGATIGFNNFVKNIKKHLLNGALNWITGEMSSAGIILPKEFDFKGILSIILQVLGISVEKVKQIAKKVIGPKYVAMLEKGVDLGKSAGAKIFKIFSIIKKDGIVGLWKFIKEQFHDLKEKLMEEARNFIIVKIVQIAVTKLVSMLIPGAGFISAIKSMIDFMLTLFAKARAIMNIIMGVIATFGEILAGNVSKVATMIENVLAKLLGMAISFLAAILGLGNIGKKMNEIIQKKIKDPIERALTKVMEKLKMLMTKLGIFKLLDKIDAGIKKGKDFVEKKKEAVKGKVKSYWDQAKNFIRNKFKKQYTEKDGKSHTLEFDSGLKLERHSVTKDLGNYLLQLEEKYGTKPEYETHIKNAMNNHKLIIKLIGKTIELKNKQFDGADKYFGKGAGEKLRDYLQTIAESLRNVPALDKEEQLNIIPKSTAIDFTAFGTGDGKIANAPLISIDSDHAGSAASATSDLTKNLKTSVKKITNKNPINVIRGHLINHELFGTGNDIRNLAPIPSQTNKDMLNTYEAKAKEEVHQGQIISLKVEYGYGRPNGKYADKIKQDGIKSLPTKVFYTKKEMTFTGKHDDAQEEINKPKNWKGLGQRKSIPINHDDFF